MGGVSLFESNSVTGYTTVRHALVTCISSKSNIADLVELNIRGSVTVRIVFNFLWEIIFFHRPHGLKVYSFVGDRTGVLHVGPNQVVIGQFADHELFEVNVFVYRDGHFHLPPTFACYGIDITVRLENTIKYKFHWPFIKRKVFYISK